jgi:hypothetical protein
VFDTFARRLRTRRQHEEFLFTLKSPRKRGEEICIEGRSEGRCSASRPLGGASDGRGGGAVARATSARRTPANGTIGGRSSPAQRSSQSGKSKSLRSQTQKLSEQMLPVAICVSA